MFPPCLPLDIRVFKKIPNLHNTLPLSLIENFRKEKVTKSLQSEEGRIEGITKLRELYILLDHVFRTRTKSSHQDLPMAPETSGYSSFDGYTSYVEVIVADNVGQHVDILDGNGCQRHSSIRYGLQQL